MRNLIASTYRRARGLTVNHLVQKCIQFIDSHNLRQKNYITTKVKLGSKSWSTSWNLCLDPNNVEVQGHPVEAVSAAFCLQPRANAQQPIQTKPPQ